MRRTKEELVRELEMLREELRFYRTQWLQSQELIRRLKSAIRWMVAQGARVPEFIADVDLEAEEERRWRGDNPAFQRLRSIAVKLCRELWEAKGRGEPVTMRELWRAFEQRYPKLARKYGPETFARRVREAADPSFYGTAPPLAKVRDGVYMPNPQCKWDDASEERRGGTLEDYMG